MLNTTHTHTHTHGIQILSILKCILNFDLIYLLLTERKFSLCFKMLSLLKTTLIPFTVPI